METTAAPQVLHLDKPINTSEYVWILLHPILEIHSCIHSHVLKLLSVYTGATYLWLYAHNVNTKMSNEYYYKL